MDGIRSVAILVGLTVIVACSPQTEVAPPTTKPAIVNPPVETAATGPDGSPATTRATDPPAPPAVSASSDNAESKMTGKHHDPLFVGWPKPEFVLLVSGQQLGYIEPCGCTGLVNQKGGLARRHTLSKQLAERGWPVVPIDVGNQIRRFGRQSEIKFQIGAEALKTIGYQAIALGADDLRLSIGELAAATLASDQQPTPFLSANAAVIERSLTPTHQILSAGGKKVGVTSVIGAEWQKKIIGGDVVLATPDDGLDAVMPKLREAKCDVLVLLAHTTIEDSQRLAQKYRDFHIVVTAGGLGEPTFEAESIANSTARMVQVGLKGMFVGVLGFFNDAQQPWRYQRVPLDDRFADSPDMLALLASYQEQLKAVGLDGLGLKPVPHPSGLKFVGTEKCGECHTKALEKWKATPHAHATESLVHPPERSAIARHFDPECLSCHVTGWNPQQFFPYESGFLDLERDKLMHGSGCENCHGPGSAHVAAEGGLGNPSEVELKSLRESMRLPLAKAEQKCKDCHDLDNSPDFHVIGTFEKYWQRVEHKGMD